MKNKWKLCYFLMLAAWILTFTALILANKTISLQRKALNSSIEVKTQKLIGLDPNKVTVHLSLDSEDPDMGSFEEISLKEIESIQLPKAWREILIGDVRWLIFDLQSYKIHTGYYNHDTKRIQSRPLNLGNSRRWGFKSQILEIKAVGGLSGSIYLYASQRYYCDVKGFCLDPRCSKTKIYELAGYIPQRPGGLYEDEETWKK
jgi:hypothetical protein